MTSRLDEIKARAEAASPPWPMFTAANVRMMTKQTASELEHLATTDVPALVAAVEAVLELHKSFNGFKSPVCRLCHPVLAPCPTVIAIRSALREVEK